MSHTKLTNQFSYVIFMSLVRISYISQSHSLTNNVQTDFHQQQRSSIWRTVTKYDKLFSVTKDKQHKK